MDILIFAEGLMALLILVLGGGVKMLFSRVANSENKIDKNKELMYREFKDSNTRLDSSTRELREEMGKTNTLILQLINKNNGG